MLWIETNSYTLCPHHHEPPRVGVSRGGRGSGKGKLHRSVSVDWTRTRSRIRFLVSVYPHAVCDRLHDGVLGSLLGAGFQDVLLAAGALSLCSGEGAAALVLAGMNAAEFVRLVGFSHLAGATAVVVRAARVLSPILLSLAKKNRRQEGQG